ncbi:MAG TPA: carbohydrate-binding family 9-like protein [Pyrinomonadaceae bacterium]|nr:carbohydrate-binding family 9-like protein [Pyrinomonadaceae bacterium]
MLPIDSSKVLIARHTPVDLAGNLDHPEWHKAQQLTIDRYWSGAAAPVLRQAKARILWSDRALHIRFDCNQGEPLIISNKPQVEKKTMGLWDRDVCEIFIAPDPSTVERYFEFEAAPTGEWLDVAIHWSAEKRESDWDFNSQMSAAARVQKDRVVILMRIPWNHWIHQPQKGERWRVNLFRCVGKDPDRGYLAWQPTRTPQPGFHLPQVFGWLSFE